MEGRHGATNAPCAFVKLNIGCSEPERESQRENILLPLVFDAHAHATALARALPTYTVCKTTLQELRNAHTHINVCDSQPTARAPARRPQQLETLQATLCTEKSMPTLHTFAACERALHKSFHPPQGRHDTQPTAARAATVCAQTKRQQHATLHTRAQKSAIVSFSNQRSSRPFRRAATRSSVFSTPHDTRTKPSVMPTFNLVVRREEEKWRGTHGTENVAEWVRGGGHRTNNTRGRDETTRTAHSENHAE